MSIVFATPGTSYFVSDLMQETKRSLLGMERIEMNELKTSIGPTDATLACTFALAGIARGSYLALDDEIVYVWAAATDSQSVTIRRGMLGTAAANHTAGAVIEVNPRYAAYAIRYALREEIRSWGPQVYTVKSAQIQTRADVRGYDLQQLVDDRFYTIISVRRSTPTAPGITNQESWPKVKNWSIIRNAPLSDFPSQCGLVVPDAYQTNAVVDSGGTFSLASNALPTLNVVYSAPFNVDNFVDTTDVTVQVGLDATMIDIPPIGAAWRLLSQKEATRVQVEAQASPADLQFVPPMYAAKAAIALKAQRDSRLNDVQIWLMNRYGIENWGL